MAPRNLLVIHFGQLGDVVLAIPSLDAIRSAWPEARITILTGTPADQIAAMAGIGDDVIGLDRVALRDGPKLRSLATIFRLGRDLRARKFDTVVDIHAFYESGLLALATGARTRIGPKRENRTLPLAYTIEAPYDLELHISDRYLAVAAAAGAKARTLEPAIVPPEAARAVVDDRWQAAGLNSSATVGLNPGAGNAVRQWPPDRYVALGRRLVAGGFTVAVFAGPEERGLAEQVATGIGEGAVSMEGMTLGELAAAFARCRAVVSNDTGPAHISAAAGTPTLVLMAGNDGPSKWAVRGDNNHCIYGDSIAAIALEDVDTSVRRLLEHLPTPVQS